MTVLTLDTISIGSVTKTVRVRNVFFNILTRTLHFRCCPLWCIRLFPTIREFTTFSAHITAAAARIFHENKVKTVRRYFFSPLYISLTLSLSHRRLARALSTADVTPVQLLLYYGPGDLQFNLLTSSLRPLPTPPKKSAENIVV